MLSFRNRRRYKIHTLPLRHQAYGNFIILGYDTEVVFVDNQPKGRTEAQQDVRIEIPSGTTKVIATTNAFVFGFGRRHPDQETYTVHDHHLGLQALQLYVHDLGDTSAVLTVRMLLRDKNGDDSWNGWVGVQLLFLGPHP